MFFQTGMMLAATNIGRVILFNAFGVLGIALQILLYQMQTRKKILYFSMVNHVAWFCYFAFQGDFFLYVLGNNGFEAERLNGDKGR